MTVELGISILQKLGYSTLIVLSTTLVGWLINRYIFKKLIAWAHITKWKWDEILLMSVKKLLPFWSFLLGIYLSVRVWKVSEEDELLGTNILIAVLIVSLTYFLLAASSKFISVLGKTGENAIAAATLTRNMVSVAIIIMGILIILAHFGVSIAPMLTAMGVGGIAIALGLQETLSNMFAGVYITWAGQIRLGDYVKLASGEEGYVSDISWRETRLRMMRNNIITIPNSKLGGTIITNYDIPAKELTILLPIGVDYSSDLQEVERITLEVAREIISGSEHGVDSYEPIIRYSEFGDSSVNFNLIFRARQYVSQYKLKSDLIKAIHARYIKEGISIPFPIRTLATYNPSKQAEVEQIVDQLR